MSGKKKLTTLLSLVLAITLLLAGCQDGADRQGDNEKTEGSHTIGVAVYSQSDPEMRMFMDYYRSYIAASFPVEFIFSELLYTTEDEVDFIQAAKEAGAEGIISFYGLDLEEIVAACEQAEMYYVLGSASISDTDFDAVKDNPWFLGVIGPADEEEFAAGSEMAMNFARQGAASYLIVSGGAAGVGNFMHYSRVEGMLTALRDELGLTYSREIAELAAAEELTIVDTGNPEVSIVISPGYAQLDSGAANLRQAFAQGDYDALLCAQGVSDVIEDIKSEISASETSMLMGVVDCFSEENYMAVEYTDTKGNALLNYVKGKYASMVAPAFVAMYNALEGDLDVIRSDGEAFRLYQSYWTAASEEEYVELYGYTQSIYENAYSSIDLMQVIKSYNADADFGQFKALTEACDMDSVRARIGE